MIGDESLAMKLYDASNTGWEGGYYNVYAGTGQLLYGGGLPDGNAAVNKMCLPKGKCHVVMMQIAGTD